MIGSKLANRYEILRELGRGGMGVVYLAFDPLLEREVAVKLLTPSILTPDKEERFKREARILARLEHPSIVTIHDIGEHAGSFFFVMPFVPGVNLRTLIQERSLQVAEVVEIGIQVAEALAASHAQGVVHRDVKPENILVARQKSSTLRIRVTDFGLAVASSETRLTNAGEVVGTVAYLSPEQVTGNPPDARTDIYSLGIVLYECFTGETPYAGDAPTVMFRIVHDSPAPPRALGAPIDQLLEAVVMRCLERDPARRYQDADEVARELMRFRSTVEEGLRVKNVSSDGHLARADQTFTQRSPFIGRSQEFVELQHRLSAALLNEAQLVLVAGDVGVGKSRLLQELETLARLRKIRVLHGRFVEQDRAFPYQGFCDVLQEAFRLSRRHDSAVDVSDLAGDLVSLFPVLSEVEAIRATWTSPSGPIRASVTKKEYDRTYIFELLARSLVRVAAGKPVVLLLEDLHAADVSLEALQYIVRRVGPTPTLIVGSYRTGDVDRRHPLVRMIEGFEGDRRFVQLRLQPFTPAEHRAFLESVLGTHKIQVGLSEKLYEAAEGNPYFTKELVRSLLDAGSLAKDAGGFYGLSGTAGLSGSALPATIQQAVERRIERLPEEDRELLSVASVLGRTFEFRDLEHLLSAAGNVEERVEKLVHDGFLEEERQSRGDRFSFGSGVLRDVLYAALPRRKRRILHKKFAEELERRFTGRLERAYPNLVHHFTEGDVPEKVVEYGLKLVRQALEAQSGEEAARAARTVLDFLDEESAPNQALTGEVRFLLATAYRMAGSTDAALREIEQAAQVLERIHDTPALIRAVVFAAETAWESRRVEEARRFLEKGLPLARGSGDVAGLSKLLSMSATVANLRGDHEKARLFLEEAEALRQERKEAAEVLPRGGRLMVAVPAAIQARHPASIKIDEEVEILSNIFDTLLATDAQGHLVPRLAESWEVTEGGRSFQLKLRHGVLMHDGLPLAAEDVVRSFERSIELSKDALPAAFSAIRGVDAFLAGGPRVAGLTAVSADTLRIDLAEPLPIYPTLLTHQRTAVVREKEDAAGATKLLGSGPFELASDHEGVIVLARSAQLDRTSEHAPMVDALEFRTGVTSATVAAGLRSGEFDLARDLLPQDLDDILRDRRLRAGLVEAPRKNLYFVLFNKSGALGLRSDARKALCGVVRTHDLVRRTLGRFAQPAEGLYPPGILGHDPGRRRMPLTREKAEELLVKSRLVRPVRLAAAVHPILQDRYQSLTAALLKVWADLGVHVDVVTPTMASYLDRFTTPADVDLLIGRWNADYDDPDNFTYTLFNSAVGRFRLYLSSDELDRDIERARTESLPAAREAVYAKIETTLVNESRLLPLFHDIDYRVASPRVRGLTLRSSPPYVNYAELAKAGSRAPSHAVRKAEGGVLNIPISGEISTLDPCTVFLVWQAEVIPAIFETLTAEAEGARIVPWLASEFRVEDGGRRFRIRLRDGVRFHDGRRVTARDVRYSFERLLQNEDSKSDWLLTPVKGAAALREGKADHIEGFRILSSSAFTIELERPLSFFPALLAHSPASIVPEGTEDFSGSYREGSVGTGPFRVVHFEPGGRLELEGNPDYWRPGLPKSDGLNFTFGVPPPEILAGFKSGRYALAWNLLPGDVETLRHDRVLHPRYGETPSLSTYYVAFNCHQGALADARRRRRLMEAVDVEGLVRRHLGRLAIPAHSLIPPGLLGYEPSARKPAAPYSSSTDGKLELTAVVHSLFEGSAGAASPSGGPYAALAHDLFDAFREKGFKVNVVDVNETRAEYREVLSSAATDLTLNRWVADYADADTFVHGLLHSKDGLMGRFAGTREIDELIARGRSETNPEVRHGIYRDIEEIVYENAMVLPLFHEQAYRFARPEVEGFEMGLSLPFVAYEKLWIKR